MSFQEVLECLCELSKLCTQIYQLRDWCGEVVMGVECAQAVNKKTTKHVKMHDAAVRADQKKKQREQRVLDDLRNSALENDKDTQKKKQHTESLRSMNFYTSAESKEMLVEFLADALQTLSDLRVAAGPYLRPVLPPKTDMFKDAQLFSVLGVAQTQIHHGLVFLQKGYHENLHRLVEQSYASQARLAPAPAQEPPQVKVEASAHRERQDDFSTPIVAAPPQPSLFENKYL